MVGVCPCGGGLGNGTLGLFLVLCRVVCFFLSIFRFRFRFVFVFIFIFIFIRARYLFVGRALLFQMRMGLWAASLRQIAQSTILIHRFGWLGASRNSGTHGGVLRLSVWLVA